MRQIAHKGRRYVVKLDELGRQRVVYEDPVRGERQLDPDGRLVKKLQKEHPEAFK